MVFKKGKPKTGGREVGTPNKVTKTLRERVKELVESRFDSLEESLNYLEPKEQIVVLMKLMEFVLPKAAPLKAEAEALPKVTGSIQYTPEQAKRLIDLIDELEEECEAAGRVLGPGDNKNRPGIYPKIN